jgi:hypothetical protein
MNQSLDKALYYLAGNGNFSAVTTEDLEKLVNEHPYFPVAQFLLAKKLKDKNDSRFLPQVQKTALYFPNPYWLHYQLLNNLSDEPIIHDNESTEGPIENEHLPGAILHEEPTSTEQASPVVLEQNLERHTTTEAIITKTEVPSIDVETKEDEHPITTVFTKNELDSASSLAHEMLQEIHEDPEHEEAFPSTAPEGISNANTALVKRENILPTIVVNEVPQGLETTREPDESKEEYFPETFIDQTLQFSEIEETEAQETATKQLHETEPKVTVAENSVIQLPAGTAALTEDTSVETDAPSETRLEEIEMPSEVHQPVQETVSQPEEEMAAISRYPDKTTEHFLEELDETTNPEVTAEPQSPEAIPIEQVATTPEAPALTEVENTSENDTAQPEEIDEHEKMFRNIKAMLDASAEEANADTKDATVPIDPYYTIDYFASQGIKLDLDKNADDKLGKQVKKFTQWLKHMKKLGPEDAIPTETISKGELEAQQIADSSNKAREVVTEAMALVLEKQGKNAKAIELYKKLSFLNPHKSAYFADKIKNLNGF